MRRNMHVMSAGLTLALAVGSLGACAGPAKVTAPTPPPVAVNEPAPVVREEFVDPILAGKVLETMDASGYTYVLLEKEGKSTWSAIPKSEVAVGDEVILVPGIDMANFESTSLKRTFKNIHFSSGIQETTGKPAAKPAAKAAALKDGATLPSNHPAIPKQNGAAVPQAGQQAAPALISGKVVESMDGGGYTYICLEKDGKKTWAAIPSDDVKVGSEMSIRPGNEMSNFSSKTLNRTFDKIIFSPGLAK